jgi:hypothetical protein
MNADRKPMMPPTPSPAYVITLAPKPGVNAVIAIRALLKYAGRQFGLRCVRIEEQAADPLQLEPSAERGVARCLVCGRGRPASTVADGECADCRH